MARQEFANSARINDAEQDFALLKGVHERYRYDPQAMAGLIENFANHHFGGTDLAEDIKATNRFLSQPEHAERIDSSFRFNIARPDYVALFKDRAQGGNAELAKIIAKLEEPVGNEARITDPRKEPEVAISEERTASERQSDQTQLGNVFAAVQRAFNDEIARALFDGMLEQRAPSTQSAYRWIAEHVKGGQEMVRRADRVSRPLYVAGFNISRGDNVRDSLNLARQSLEPRAERTSAPSADIT